MRSSYDIEKNLTEKYGIAQSGEGGRQETSRSRGKSYEMESTLLSKYPEDATKKRRSAVADWKRRYNSTIKEISAKGVVPNETAVNSLIQDFDQIREFADRMGLPNAGRYIDNLQTTVRKQKARAATASGLLAEDAEALRAERDGYRKELGELSADEIKRKMNGVQILLLDNANQVGFGAARQKYEQGLREQYAQLEKQYELAVKVADIEKQLDQYDRIDSFQQTRITPMKGQTGFATAREDYAAGAPKRERQKAQNGQALKQAYQELEALTWNKSPSQYQSEPAYLALIERIDRIETEQQSEDELGAYLGWYEGLSDDHRQALLDGSLNSQAPENRELVASTPAAIGKHWERMTEDEINAYYYIANTEGISAAGKFLEELQVTLDWRHTTGRENAAREQMADSPTWANALRGVGTVGANVIAGPMAFASDALNTMQGKAFNPYSNAHYLQNITGTTRGAAAGDIQKSIAGDGKSKFWNGVGEVAANAYQAGLSTLDSFAGIYTMGNAYTAAMGMGAASSRMRELYESGATDAEIYRGAVGSGILEALFEKVSLDSLAENFIKANPEKWIRKMLTQAGVEGSEEVFTEITNQILDAINRGVNSDHNQRVWELMNDAENPMSREEAETKAAAEDAMDVFWAGLGGVMSGGMSAVGGAAMDSSRQNMSGQDILARNAQEQIIAEAQELRPGDTLAQDMESKQKEGTLGKNEGILGGIKDSRDATRLGRLLEQNVADMTSRDRSAVQTAVEARLKAEGTRILDLNATAEAITKSLAGEGLGVYDRFLLASNEKVADKVRKEVYSAADGTTAENAWVNRIETYSHMAGTKLRETNVEKAGREAMETTVKEEFGPYAEQVMELYAMNRGSQNRADYVAEAKQMYQAGMDGVALDQAPETSTLTDWQREIIWDMGQGKSDYDYDNNQGFATIKGETTPVNIVGVESAGDGKLTLRTDEGETVDAKNVTFGSYSQSKLYSVISAMGVDRETANEIVAMSQETGLDLNTFSRAMQDAFFAGRNGIPFADIGDDRYAMKLTQEERKAAWQAGRAAARERAVKKGKRVQQGKHGRARGGVKIEDSARSIRSLNAQQQAGMNAANVLGAMGLDITVYASTEEQRAKGMENGHIQLSDGSIHIDLNAGDSGEGVMAWALSHEFTHFVEEMSPEKFQTFQEVLFEELGQNGQDVMTLIEEKVAVLSSQEKYSEFSEDRLWEIATSEVVAEMMEPMLTDTDAIARISDNLRQQDKGLWEKIKDWLQGLVEKLKNAYKDLTPGSAIAQQTRSIVTQSEEILNAWVDVATDAVVNYNLQDGQKNNTPGGVQYSARRLSDQIDDIANQTFDVRNHVYYGTTPRALSNILSIPIMPMLGTQTHAYAMALSKQQARNEGRRTSGLHFHELGWDTVKAIPDMLSHPLAVIKSNTDATDSRFVVVTNATDKEGRPIIAAIAPKGSGKYYNLDMMATVMLSEYGRNGFQNYLAKAKTENRILWIDKKNHHEQASPGVQFSNALLHGDYTSNLAQFKQIVKNEFAGTVFQNTFDEKGDRLFSSRNVQQTKNLVALHNITEDKFLKTLELGGFPMPSIAITKADIPHTNFGDITVVFGRETIDPKANRKNTVYSADAWTPTVPQVEYEADSKATSRVYKRLSGLRNQVDEYFQRDLGYATYDLENALNRYGGEEGVVQSALDNYGVKAAYLEEQGKHIQPVTRQKQVSAAITPEVEDKYLKIMQVLGITSPEEIGGMILKDVRNQHGEELEKIWPGVTKTALRLSNTLKKIQGYLLGIGTEAEYKTVTDIAATKEAVDSAIDQEKFEVWVRNLYQGVEKSSGVYNGKPRFTGAGNSRTFKQLHLPATLEGIVKAMAAQNNGNTKNVSGFNGVKTLRAGTAERFSSIADMHKMEGRLQNLTEAQQNEIHDSLSNRLYDTIKAIDEESGANLRESNSLIRYDTIGEILMEIAESGSYNVADIQRVFQQYGKAISDETAMAAKELLFDISQMPVNIFEAKPERAVGFEEIKNVLVPDTASQKLLQELDSRGIPYQTYQAGNEEQRHQMVQDMEDIRFSQRSAAQLERENEKLRRDKEYLKELVRIQRQGNKDVVPTRASVIKQAEELKKAAGARGNTNELAAVLDKLYRHIGKGTDMSQAILDQLAGDAADWLMEHQPVQRDSYSQDVLDWMKKRHVSLSQTQVDEIKYQYGSLREFQSAIKGSIIIDQKANTSLNQLWQEGASQFADQFDADMNEGDMPGAFADLVERLRNSESAETAEARYYREEIRRELMDKVYDTYFSVKPIDSVSDAMQKKIDALKEERAADRKKFGEELAKLKAEKQDQKAEKAATLRAMQGIRKAAVESYRKQQSASDQRMRKLYEQQYRLVMDDYQRQLETMEGSEKTQAKVEGWRKTEERGKLQRTLTTLNKMMLNPTKTAFVPDSLQPAVIKAMEAMNNYRMPDEIDMGKIRELQNELNELILDGATKNKKRIRAIHKQLNQLQGDYGSPKDNLVELKRMYAELMDANEGKVAQVYDEGVEGFIADAMEAIGDTDYSDLSLKQLQALNDAYAAILHRVRTANNTFAYGQKEAIDQLAKTVAGDFRRLPDREKLSGEQVDALEKFGWNNLKPEYAFQRLGSATMTTLYHNLRKGEDVFYQDVEDARGFALGAMARHGYQNWKDQTIEYESVDGKKFSLNLEERMSLYAYSRRRQAIEHLTKGGIVLNENTKRTVKGSLGIQTEKVFHDYNNYRLSLDTIQAIGDSLTQQQRAFAEEMQGYLSTVCADKNNEISRALYGVSKAKEKYYWPLKSSNLFSERVRNQQQNPGNRQKNAGHMKATTPHANNPVEIAGFMETWGNHVNNTAMYHAFTLPMEDFLRVYNFNNTSGAAEESIVQLITKKHGKGATDYIDQFLKDLNQGVRADPRESIASSLTSKFKKGAVSASLSVAIQQPSAVGRAFAVIDPKYFSLADLRYYATSTVKQEAAEKQWEKVKEYAPVAGIKEMGRFDVNMGMSTVDFITGAGETGFVAKLDEISGYLPERMDQATWLMIWNAAERQCKAQGYKGEALNVAAGKLFTECITKTQVYDSVFSRSGNMRSKSLYMNMATSFMAEPTTTANMVQSALADLKNKNYKAAGRKMASVATATVLNAILASLVYAARDDDEDKPYKEKYLKSLTSELVDGINPLGYVPIAKDIWSLLQGYDVERSDMALWSTAIDIFNRLKDAHEAMASLSEDDADYEEKLAAAQKKVRDGWQDAAGAICNLLGIPAKNALREIRALVNTWETVGEGRKMDGETAQYAMWEAVQEYAPKIVRDTDNRNEELFKAMESDSEVWINRMKAHYDNDEKAFESAVRSALRQEEPRIRMGAKMLSENPNSSEYKRLVQDMVKEGHFTKEQVEGAIQAEATSIKGEFADYSAKTVAKFVDLYEDNLLTAEQFTDFWEYQGEKDENDKQKHSQEEIVVYIARMKVNAKAKDTLFLKVMGYTEKKLDSTPWHSSGYTAWEAKAEHPVLAEAGDTAAQKYVEIQNKEISADLFAKAWMFKYEKGEDDKRLYDWKDVRDYIDALPISDYSKDELFLALGYNEKTLKKIRWS